MTGTVESRVVLVVGASRGIGVATALAFAGSGDTMVLAARDQARLECVAHDVRRHGGAAHIVPTDATDEGAVEELFSAVRSRVGPLDVMVNCVGGNPHFKSILDWTADDWDGVQALNLRSAFLLATGAARSMRRDARPGVIVTVSSIGGSTAVPNTVPYCVAKAGVEQLTRGMAVELAPSGIRVNAVAPGFVETDLTASLRGNPTLTSELEGAVPLGRMAHADEVARTVHHVVGAAYMTGAVTTLDGGYSQSLPWPEVRPPRST